MKEDILAFLGLMRRASALAIGEENASEAIAKGKARLLLLPSDGREKTALHAEHLLEGRSALKIQLPFSEEELARSVGTGRCSMAAVTDLGFAKALMEQLDGAFPGRYGKELEAVAFRHEKAQRRKKEKPGVRTKKKSAGED